MAPPHRRSPPPDRQAVRSGCAAPSAYRAQARLAGGDRGFALEQETSALDDRHVDHPAVDRHRADPFGERFVINRDNAVSVVDLCRRRAEFLVEDRDLARMDDRGADKTEASRAANRLAEPSRSWNSAIEPIKPSGMIPAARAANTAICLGMVSASGSAMMPAEVAKSSAPRVSAHSRG